MSDNRRLPPNQALLPSDRWPIVGERAPRSGSDPWRVEIIGCVRHPRTWDLADLRARPCRELVTDIHCVTRWSKFDVRFFGFPLAELLDEAGILPEARYLSFEARSDRDHSTSLPVGTALELNAFVAFEADGKPLSPDRGGPIRLVVPGRYFYKSLKWLHRIAVLDEDRLGYWEGRSGYHNNADPWREERYIIVSTDHNKVRRMVASRNLSGQDLLGLVADRMDLGGLDARDAVLRNASFIATDLSGADFAGANLSNARLLGARLTGARLRGADLEGADFRGADLRGADLTGASLFGASFVPEPGQDDGWGAARMDDATRIDDGQRAALSDVQRAFLEARRGGPGDQ